MDCVLHPSSPADLAELGNTGLSSHHGYLSLCAWAPHGRAHTHARDVIDGKGSESSWLSLWGGKPKTLQNTEGC